MKTRVLLSGVFWGVWLSQGMHFLKNIQGLSSQGTGFEGDLDSLALANYKIYPMPREPVRLYCIDLFVKLFSEQATEPKSPSPLNT